MNKKMYTMFSALMALTATAGNDPFETNDSSRVVDLDEVVVVAQPKEQYLLRQQPLSSSVFGREEMNSLNVRDLRELSAFVPSFAMPQYGSRLTSSVYMRGTGSRLNAAAPSVPVYYDHIPLLSKSAFNSYFYQLDRIDVLRGPQATLYGMNSEGGLVRIYSKSPMTYEGTDVNVGLGNGFQRRVEVAHYRRLSERMGLSVAAFYNGQDGFLRNEPLDEYNDKSDEAGARLRWGWNVAERFKADLTADYQFVRQNAFPYGLYDVDEGEVDCPSTTFMSTYRRNMLNVGLSLSYEARRFLVSSTTSFQHLYDYMDMDQDYTVANRMTLNQHQKMNGVTEELSVKSKGDGRWQWTTGVFGSYQSMTTNAPVTFEADMNAMLAQTFLNYMPERVRGMFSAWEIPLFIVPGQYKTPQTNLAAFHETNLRLSDRLTATVGLRLDYSKVRVDYDANARMDLHFAAQMGPRLVESTNSLTDSLTGSASKSSKQLLPKFGLSYRLGSAGSNVYAQVSKGYRAGGYNFQMFSDIMQTEMQANGMALQNSSYNIPHDADAYERVDKTIEYEPETSWNYEVGTHLNLFGGKMHADLSAYLMQIKNQQLSVMAGNYGFGRMMVNAGKSNHYGVEAALRGKAFDDKLTWAASYGFTHATFKEYKDTVTVSGQKLEVDYKDNRVPYVPAHTFSAMADYRFDVADDAVLRSVTVGLNVSGNGKTYWDEANTASQKLYATLGAHVCLDMGAVSVDFWGRNLTDTRYATFGLAYGNGFIGQRGLPLQLGVDLRLHFL